MGELKLKKDWEVLSEIISTNDAAAVEQYIDSLSSNEMIHTLFRLSNSEQQKLVTFLTPEKAAELIEEVPQSYAVEVIESMDPGQAASIVSEMSSDEQANILQSIHSDEAEEILSHMDEEEADIARSLIEYSPDVAGGLMMKEFLSYPKNFKVSQVINDLTERSDDYALYNVQYIYVVHTKHKLKGVLRLRDVVLSDPNSLIGDLAKEALFVKADTTQDELFEFFENHEISACPVVDDKKNILGVIRKRAVESAQAERADIDHQKSQGIVNGEELRSMNTLLRSKRRLSWLSVNIVLNIMAASVIAMFQDTLTAVIALAVFLPIVSDMSGCSGNQSVAVSMRELTLGIARPSDVFRVWLKEISVGGINGLVLGSLLAFAAWLWMGNPYLGLVVGLALALNTMIAVSIGGSVPLILKKFDIDPAIASGPILTTITDMCGFFLVLGLATLMLPLLVV
jgi:magnesium transporter